VLSQIKDEHISPRPRWQFLLKAGVLWGAFACSVIFGSMAFGLLLLDTSYDEELVEILDNHWGNLLTLIPFLWLIFLAGFILIALYNYRHTAHGYKRTPLVVLSASLLMSIILGIGLYRLGVSEVFGNGLEDFVPYYARLASRHRVWSRPEVGFLSGKVVQSGSGTVVMRDWQGKVWDIKLTGTKYLTVALTRPDSRIRVRGLQSGENSFEAVTIRPWRTNNSKTELEVDENGSSELPEVRSPNEVKENKTERVENHAGEREEKTEPAEKPKIKSLPPVKTSEPVSRDHRNESPPPDQEKPKTELILPPTENHDEKVSGEEKVEPTEVSKPELPKPEDEEKSASGSQNTELSSPEYKTDVKPEENRIEPIEEKEIEIHKLEDEEKSSSGSELH
jgi:hypothetical protein